MKTAHTIPLVSALLCFRFRCPCPSPHPLSFTVAHSIACLLLVSDRALNPPPCALRIPLQTRFRTQISNKHSLVQGPRHEPPVRQGPRRCQRQGLCHLTFKTGVSNFMWFWTVRSITASWSITDRAATTPTIFIDLTKCRNRVAWTSMSGLVAESSPSSSPPSTASTSRLYSAMSSYSGCYGYDYISHSGSFYVHPRKSFDCSHGSVLSRGPKPIDHHSCNTTLISSHISLCELSESSSARGIAARCRYTFQAFTHRLRESTLILNTGGQTGKSFSTGDRPGSTQQTYFHGMESSKPSCANSTPSHQQGPVEFAHNISPSPLTSGVIFHFGSHGTTTRGATGEENNHSGRPSVGERTHRSHTTSSLGSSDSAALDRTGSNNDSGSAQAVSHILESQLEPASSILGDRPNNSPPPLRAYHGPIPAVASNGDDASHILQMLTLLSRRHIYRDISVMARRTQCIRNGSEALNRPELQSMKNATRRLHRDIFPTELTLLDNLLTNVLKNKALVPSATRSEPIYRLRVDNFEVLLASLRQQRQIAEVAFVIIGRIIPKLPTFGPTGSVNQWHSSNDLEILSICFRLEVENLLWELDNIFDFQYGMPRSIIARLLSGNLSEAGQQFLKMKAFPLTASEWLQRLKRTNRSLVQQPLSVQTTVRSVQLSSLLQVNLATPSIHRDPFPPYPYRSPAASAVQTVHDHHWSVQSASTMTPGSSAIPVYCTPSAQHVTLQSSQATDPGRFDDVRIYRKPRPAWFVSPPFRPQASEPPRIVGSISTYILASHLIVPTVQFCPEAPNR
ncbi:hypothetical protein C8R43DRAFT_1112144 [Mycena crocata]|nr:hypothetical protein C8R43DRAFT_1112144 [Mycena crocata]